MNSSSIVMAFILAGVLSIVVHNIALGPVVIQLPEAVGQTSEKDTNPALMKRTESINRHQLGA